MHLNDIKVIQVVETYQDLLENRVHQIFEELHMQKHEARALKELEPLKLKDIDTYLHSLRVSILCYEAAKALKEGLQIRDLKPAVYFGLEHDDGKEDVPIEVLRKKQKLTEEDMNRIRVHPITAYHKLKDKFPLSAFGALGHHSLQENGYPYKEYILREMNKLPSGFRQKAKELYFKFIPILAIVDTYDAMVTRDNITSDNEKFGGRIPPRFTKELMLEHFPKLHKIITILYDKGVLGKDYYRTLRIAVE